MSDIVLVSLPPVYLLSFPRLRQQHRCWPAKESSLFPQVCKQISLVSFIHLLHIRYFIEDHAFCPAFR